MDFSIWYFLSLVHSAKLAAVRRGIQKLPAEVESIYKSTVKASERLKVSNSHDVYDVFLANWDKNKNNASPPYELK